METIAVHFEKKINTANELCCQKAALFNIKAYGTYSYHEEGVT
jgi:hypothetical protein